MRNLLLDPMVAFTAGTRAPVGAQSPLSLHDPVLGVVGRLDWQKAEVSIGATQGYPYLAVPECCLSLGSGWVAPHVPLG